MGSDRSGEGQKFDKRCRASRPERIDNGDDILVRNDIIAQQYGMTVRTVDRIDASGAPFILIGGVKYRPLRGFQEYLASRIARHNLAPLKGRRK